MITAMASGTVQTLQPFSTAISDSSSAESKGVSSPNADTTLAKDGRPIPGDTVSISGQSRQGAVDGKKEAVKEKTAANDGKKSGTVTITATVQFVYDLNGELIVRQMDADNRLIYQVPSKLALRMKELAPKSNSSVDTKA